MPATNSNIVFEDDFGRLATLVQGRRAFAIVDHNLTHLAPSRIFGDNVITVRADEQAKSMATIGNLASRLMELGAGRDALLVGIGGGITTDIAGFLASVYMRGIAFGAVPTTMLSQLDASIGGKNGVNLNGFKNIIGTFSQPEFIFICQKISDTEPEESRRCGIAEMLKTFIISDRKSYFEAVERFSTGEGTSASELVKRAAMTKCAITGRDPFDRGERRLLNLGHTFGHAIEKCSGGRIPHGMAVAQGILIAARISSNLGRMDAGDLTTLEKDFRALRLLPTDCSIPPSQLAEAVRMDKKRYGGELDFIIPVSIGKAEAIRLPFERLYGLLPL